MSKFASFLAGMGGGYIKAKDKEYERERQAKEDAWREEQQGWQRADRAEKDALRTSMKDAFADRSTIEGTAVTGTTGTNLYKDPTQAQAAADEARIEAEMRGESPSAVATMQATGITGNMSKGHQITTEPVDLASLNSRDAKMARGVNALMAAGDPEKAISMENTVMQNKAARLGLDVAQLKFIDETTRGQMSNALASGATWHEGAAKFVTQSQYPTIKDVKGESVVSPDGKTVTLFAVMPDGTRRAAGTYPADETGSIKFMEQFGSLPIETRIGLMQGRATAATDQANKDRDYALREREAKVRQDALLMRGAGSGSSSGRGVGAAKPGTSFDPYEGKKKKNAQSAATQLVDDAIVQGGKPVTPQERARLISDQVFKLRDAYAGKNAIRQRNSVFLSDARAAQTPEQIEVVRQAALKRGFTPAEMAALDKRFATAKVDGDGDKGPKEINFSQLTGKRLAEIAKKPRGISSYEAAKAQEEIDRRKSGPQELKAW